LVIIEVILGNIVSDEDFIIIDYLCKH